MLGGALEARRGRGEHTAKGARAGCKMRLQEDDFPLQLRSFLFLGRVLGRDQL